MTARSGDAHLRSVPPDVADAIPPHRDALLSRPGVVGVGVGTRIRRGRREDEPCITAFVVRKQPRAALAAADVVPTRLPAPSGADVAVDVVEIGVPTAPPPPLPPVPSRVAGAPAIPAFVRALRLLSRPGRGGLSASHARFPVGTLTLGVRDRHDATLCYALSCNHVFGLVGGARVGDPVLQPAVLDGGTAADVIGRFARSAPLRFDGRTPEVVDASLASCTSEVSPGAVAGIGNVAGIRDPRTVRPGEWVCKVGRTTGLTYGTVLATHATIEIDYSALGFAGRRVFYEQQIVTTGMGAYGDSGSLLLDLEGRGIGMLFSGGDGGTVHNPLIEVLRKLDVFIPSDVLVGGSISRAT